MGSLHTNIFHNVNVIVITLTRRAVHICQLFFRGASEDNEHTRTHTHTESAAKLRQTSIFRLPTEISWLDSIQLFRISYPWIAYNQITVNEMSWWHTMYAALMAAAFHISYIGRSGSLLRTPVSLSINRPMALLVRKCDFCRLIHANV